MERYPLSADFAEKQLQLLQRKYGGPDASSRAALTIQSAFRRYSMAKKFADLTAQVKTEKRFSRRLDYPTAAATRSTTLDAASSSAASAERLSPVVATSQRSSPQQQQSSASSSPSSVSRVTVIAPPQVVVEAAALQGQQQQQQQQMRAQFHVHHEHLNHQTQQQQQQYYLHHNHQHHHRHQRQRSRDGSTGSSGGGGGIPDTGSNGSSNSHIVHHEGCPAAASSASSAAAAAAAASAETGSEGGGAGGEGGGNSCPDIQSFPLDETSVYTHLLSKQQSATHVLATSSASGHPYHHHHHHHHHHISRSGSTRRESTGSSPAATSASSSLKKAASLSSSQPPHVQKRIGSRSPLASSSSLATDHPSTRSASTGDAGGGGSGGGSPQPHLHFVGGSRQHTSLTAGMGGNPYVQHGGAGGGHFSQDVMDGGSTRVLRQQIAVPQASSASTSSASAAIAYRQPPESTAYTVNEVLRKRHYRTGLNIFNKKPEKGVAYLIKRGFLENSPSAVSRFLITRKGLSKQMIGEYLGNIQLPFNMTTLNCFALEMDFSGMQIDTALRKFQTYFRMPGEAQKIERLMEVFSQRYCQCNPDLVAKLHSTTDTAFILAFAIILLNTDLHTPSLKPEKRMKLEDFIRNLRGIDNNRDLDEEMLTGIYERIRNQEFRPGSDHVTQVTKVQQTIVAKCPNLAIPHRRLVCYCRLYEVPDPYKKERPGIHQREIFLFNDILVITKIHSRKKNTVTYAFRQSHLLAAMQVNLFETQFYPYGIQIAQKWDRKVVLMLNARNEHDRSKFVEDLKESIAEMDELETLRLEGELEKQRVAVGSIAAAAEKNRDSGITDATSPSATGTAVEQTMPSPEKPAVATSMSSKPLGASSSSATASNGVVLRRSAINNSLLDLSDATAEKMTRRGSVGSLDSGMSVSFQSTNTVGVAGGSFCIGNGSANGSAVMHQPHQHYPGGSQQQQQGQFPGNQRRGGGGYSSQASRRRNK